MASTPEYSIRLSSEERDRLSQFDHALDYEFSEEELGFLETNGYLVLRGIIPTETINVFVKEALVQIEKTGVKLSDSSSWASIPYHGCFNVWHTKTYNQLRQNPLLYSVFAQLLKTGNLTVSVDRMNLKSPCLAESKSQAQALENANLELHTDLNYWHADSNKPIYQGGLCLQDCPLGGGGFFCIPGFHRPERVLQYMQEVNRGKFGEASSIIPKKGKTFVTYFDQVDANANKIEVPLNKGDFVIWNNNLPHNGGKNSLMIPQNRASNSLENFRMHAFIMFVPLDGPCADEEVAAFYQKYQAETRHAIMSGTRPLHFATRNRTPGGKAGDTETKVSSGPITSLGERILGIVPYDVKEE
jgi:ectoine hydroxylase-related dioxygenase (phytanoyl-CoA dioxygenase family)